MNPIGYEKLTLDSFAAPQQFKNTIRHPIQDVAQTVLFYKKSI